METIFRIIYNEMCDTDTHEPTWQNKCLDYALVSRSLLSCNCKTERIETSSDHIALLTKFEI